MLKSLLLALATLVPASAQAQLWATRDVCKVVLPEIDPQVLPEDLLASLRADAEKMPNPRGRFWRIQSPDGAVSHLWGTMHSNDPLILDLPHIVQKRLSGARVVALEFDPSAPTRDALLDRNEWSPFRQGNISYDFDDTGLDPRVIKWIRTRLDGLGWGADAANYLMLAAIAENLLLDPCEDFTDGIIPAQDGYIQTLGLIAGARILGLEPEFAFSDYLSAPENQGTTLSILAVYGAYLLPKTSSAGRATDFAIYLQGETALEMQRERAQMAEIYGPELADEYLQLTNGYMVDARNKTFLQTARPDLHKGGMFMAIGSFHLPGERGMIALLRAAGYAVSRIPLPGEIPDAIAKENLK